MATKTLTLEVDAYERLKRAKRSPRESLSEAVRRLPMPAGELAAGESLGRDRAKWESFIRPFRFLGYNDEVAWRFGVVFRDLRRQGTLIGASDMWIAATALANDLPAGLGRFVLLSGSSNGGGTRIPSRHGARITKIFATSGPAAATLP